MLQGVFTRSQGHQESFLGRRKEERKVEVVALNHITLIKIRGGSLFLCPPHSICHKEGIVKASSWPKLTLEHMVMLC